MMSMMMMSSVAAGSKLLRPSVQRLVLNHGSRSMTVLSKESGEEYEKKNYSDRMKKTGRPVSPHVTVYAFPVAAISSITNRVTGVALALGGAGLGFAELVGGSGTALTIMQTIGASSSPLIVASAKFCVAFPVSYHYLGAIRHLVWDAKPEFLTTNEEVAKSSYFLFGGALAASGILMIV